MPPYSVLCSKAENPVVRVLVRKGAHLPDAETGKGVSDPYTKVTGQVLVTSVPFSTGVSIKKYMGHAL